MPLWKTGTVEIDGARLTYDEAGDGPALLLLHAGIADRRMWDDQLALAEHVRLVRCDLPGFGDSTLPSGEFSPLASLAALLDRLSITRAAVLGSSFGGRLALDFALEYPERVGGLVLVGSGLGGYRMSAALDAFETEIGAALEAGDLDRAAEIDLRVWVDGPRRAPDQLDPDMRARANAMARRVYEVASEAGRPVLPAQLAIERLEALRAPTLVIVGDQDQPDMLAIADRLAEGIAGARKVAMPGVAHLPNMEQPRVFNDIVLDFLRAVPRWNGVRDGR
jgi:pimeloyl-ACP methyl ester carboxylesterase